MDTQSSDSRRESTGCFLEMNQNLDGRVLKYWSAWHENFDICDHDAVSLEIRIQI